MTDEGHLWMRIGIKANYESEYQQYVRVNESLIRKLMPIICLCIKHRSEVRSWLV